MKKKEEKNVCLHRVHIHSMNIISDIATPPVVRQQITESEISNMEENVTLDDCMFLGYIYKKKNYIKKAACNIITINLHHVLHSGCKIFLV